MIVNTLLITTTQLEPFYYAGLLFLQPWAQFVMPFDPRHFDIDYLHDVLPLYMFEYITNIYVI